MRDVQSSSCFRYRTWILALQEGWVIPNVISFGTWLDKKHNTSKSIAYFRKSIDEAYEQEQQH